MFRVVNLRSKKAWPNEIGTEELLFEDGEKAKLAASHLNRGVEAPMRVYAPRAHTGDWLGVGMPLMLEGWFGPKDVYINGRDKWQVRKIANDLNWRQAQYAHFESGKYKPVPWADQPEWQNWIKGRPQCDHFVHISAHDPECIAYTKNTEAGEMDIQTRTTPAKYFTKFIKEDSEYKKFADQWIAIWVKIQTAIELKFAHTREEMRKVYEDGPSSCMCGGVNRFFRTKVAPHPVETYAGGDLAVAYLTRKSGKISARVLVWPDKKIYNRVYGDDASILDKLLRAENYRPGGLHGAKLVLVNVARFTGQANTYLIPSIDTCPNTVSYIEETKEFRICHNPPLPEERKHYGCGSANGWTTINIPYVSELSGKTFNPQAERGMVIYVSKTKTQVWATSEVREHAYYCYVNKRYYSKEKCPPIPTRSADGAVVSKSPYEYKKKTAEKVSLG